MTDETSIQIRSMTDADTPFMTEIMNFYVENSTAHGGTETYKYDHWNGPYRQFSERYPWLIAEVNGDIAGFAFAAPFNPRESYDWTAESTVYLVDGFAGQGIGRALYATIIEVLTKQGFRSVMGGITNPNPVSEALHASFGFTKVADMPNMMYKFGKWHGKTEWQLELNGPETALQPTLPVRNCFNG